MTYDQLEEKVLSCEPLSAEEQALVAARPDLQALLTEMALVREGLAAASHGAEAAAMSEAQWETWQAGVRARMAENAPGGKVVALRPKRGLWLMLAPLAAAAGLALVLNGTMEKTPKTQQKAQVEKKANVDEAFNWMSEEEALMFAEVMSSEEPERSELRG